MPGIQRHSHHDRHESNSGSPEPSTPREKALRLTGWRVDRPSVGSIYSGDDSVIEFLLHGNPGHAALFVKDHRAGVIVSRRRRVDGGDETVTATGDRLDDFISRGMAGQRFAQQKDLLSQIAGLDHLPGPELLEQLIFAHDAIATFNEIEQEIKALTSQRDLLFLPPQRPTGLIDAVSLEMKEVPWLQHHAQS